MRNLINVTIMTKPGSLFIVSAPSGAGKTTLVKELIARLHGAYSVTQVITYTTKQPRPFDVQGVDYHFLSPSEFIQKIEEGFFAEHSTVYGAYYGFPMHVLHEVKKGRNYIAIVDRAGAASLRALHPASILIWIKPPDAAALAARLTHRAQDSEETIAFRLALARQELVDDPMDDLFDHILINEDLEKSIAQLEELVRSQLTE